MRSFWSSTDVTMIPSFSHCSQFLFREYKLAIFSFVCLCSVRYCVDCWDYVARRNGNNSIMNDQNITNITGDRGNIVLRFITQSANKITVYFHNLMKRPCFEVELRWISWGQKVPCTLGWTYTERIRLYCDCFNWCVLMW
jgi:hypothetical protein